MNIAELYHLYLQHPVISTDSRDCPPDALFFALKGASFDGNLFAEKALQTCAYAIIDHPDVKTSDRMIVTDDVLKTLQQLAAYHRKRLGTPLIGITGTNGKTTTKELLAAVLSTKYNLLYTQGNLNNHIGVPLTLLRLTPGHEMAVIEMGANHPGEIRDLVQIVQPDYGIITNVGRAHLEGFGSFEGVIRTKGELYDYLRQTNGKLFIHQENEYLQAIAQGLEQITYGASSKAFVSGQVISSNPFLRFQWRQQEVSHTVDTHLVGDYNLWNALAAIAAGRYFDVPAEQINRAITAYEPTNNRSQWKKTASNELIIDAYNANPSSMQVALTNFASLSAAPKAVILGDMRELGASSLEWHAEIVKQLQEQAFDRVFLCGEQFTAAGGNYRCFPTVEALIDYFSANPLQGYHILIKGSHGVHLEEIVGYL
ncbi:MAG: UDP-N-acetylmuramoyl-tripeptide--D-alanyl-D-alanine ligase [Tannerella sp.]|jgi:UDP-N-acetylmuramoyl-tripeptide--D-alanyl-D-alanine ligase|nr:UDP-N-acetylmuramoyl-tripeptide--D-alanyl-D-alanine ligase [Tannerella sp.]